MAGYYLGAKLNGRNEDIDFNASDFMLRVNSDLIGKYVNIASRAAGTIAKRFDGRLGQVSEDGEALLATLRAERHHHRRLRGANATARARPCSQRPRERICRCQQALGAGQP